MTMLVRPVTIAKAVTAAFLVSTIGTHAVRAEVDYEPVPQEITTPDEVETHLGTLDFTDGYPTEETARAIQDELDYIHGVNVFLNTIQGVSMYALRKGFLEAGVNDNDVLLFSEMMDANSLFLTANADTPYFLSFIDLTKGPMVVETPPNVLAMFDDMWFRWIIDFGLPGPDRGTGGNFLIVPPGYDGPLPDSGYHVGKSHTTHALMLGRAFLVDDSPEPPIAAVREHLKIYPYEHGGFGTAIATHLAGDAPLGPVVEPPSPRFVEGSGVTMNTIPPNDFGHYELLNELVQMEPAEAMDPEIAGQMAAIGIVKGQEFNPDGRMRAILEKSVGIANAGARTLGMGAHPKDSFRYYGEDSAWWASLWEGGFEFTNPPPEVNADGSLEFYPNLGARKLHSRTSWFYTATGITPAMIMRLTGIGSQYLIANVDSQGEPFDGSKTYRLNLPANIPAGRFWSMTVYDQQTRGMLQTDQRFPRAGSQSYPSPAAEMNADGSTTLYFSPAQPEGVPRGNWIQTLPKRSWFAMLRLYFPEQPFFDKSWRAGEFELVE